jgi:hypothetical protein
MDAKGPSSLAAEEEEEGAPQLGAGTSKVAFGDAQAK